MFWGLKNDVNFWFIVFNKGNIYGKVVIVGDKFLCVINGVDKLVMWLVFVFF